MQTYDSSLRCPDCSGRLIDASDELVCPVCGVVKEKEVLENRKSGVPVAIDFTGQALGGYLGPVEAGGRDRLSRVFPGSPSSYGYLKLVSDYACREEGAVYTCAKMIERVSEKLCLPNAVMTQAIVIAKKLLSSNERGRGVTVASISSYALIASCRISGVASASAREIVRAHWALGRRVTVSSLIQLSLDLPVKKPPRRPEDYIARILAKLAPNVRLARQLQDEEVSVTVYFNSIRELAREILVSVEENSKAGHRPCALAATAVYAAELLLAQRESRRRRITQRDVAGCGDTAEYTVREQYREIFMPTLLHSRTGAVLHLPAPREM